MGVKIHKVTALAHESVSTPDYIWKVPSFSNTAQHITRLLLLLRLCRSPLSTAPIHSQIHYPISLQIDANHAPHRIAAARRRRRGSRRGRRGSRGGIDRARVIGIRWAED